MKKIFLLRGFRLSLFLIKKIIFTICVAPGRDIFTRTSPTGEVNVLHVEWKEFFNLAQIFHQHDVLADYLFDILRCEFYDTRLLPRNLSTS